MKYALLILRFFIYGLVFFGALCFLLNVQLDKTFDMSNKAIIFYSIIGAATTAIACGAILILISMLRELLREND